MPSRDDTSPSFLDTSKPIGLVRSSLSWGWLLVLGALGVAMVAAHLWLESEAPVPIYSATLANFGTGLILFAVLLVAQQRFIERVFDQTVRVLDAGPAPKDVEDLSEAAMPGDFQSEFGPRTVASEALHALADGRYEDAWSLFDANLRLCRAQAWIYNKIDGLGLSSATEEELDVVAAVLANGPNETNELWRDFAETERQHFEDAFRDISTIGFGHSARRRIVGPHHEVVLFFRMPPNAPNGFVIENRSVINGAVPMLVSAHVDGDSYFYRVAAISTDRMPMPGWPPTWWSLDDLPAERTHPGLRGEVPASPLLWPGHS